MVRTSDGVSLKSIWPTVKSLESMDTNNSSIVSMLNYKSFSGLLTGDIDTEVASQLSNDNYLKDIDYLKVPHHGSKYNLTSEQLRLLSPIISTISVGKNNSYGHPSIDTIAKLHDVNSEVLRTDEDGMVSIVVNISGISVRSE
jgi:competence protein ComEC